WKRRSSHKSGAIVIPKRQKRDFDRGPTRHKYRRQLPSSRFAQSDIKRISASFIDRTGESQIPSPINLTIRLPVLGKDRPAFVITPLATDLQVPPGVPFSHEPRALDESDRCAVPRLNISFKSMQFEAPKRIAKQQCKAFAHITAALVRRADVITKISASKSTHKDLTQSNR